MAYGIPRRLTRRIGHLCCNQKQIDAVLSLKGHIAKIKVAVSVDKQRTLIRIYMEKYISVRR